MDEEQVQTRTRPDIRKDMDDAEKKFQGYIIRRNDFNDKARQTREERDLLHSKRKEIMEEVHSLREEKSKAFDELKKHKERRDALHLKAKTIIDLKRAKRGSTKGDNVAVEMHSLKGHLRKLEYTQQTTPLTMEKERDIIDEIREGYTVLRELEKDYAEIEEVNDEVSSMDNELDGLFKEADSEHQLVVKYYETSRKLQKKMDEIIKEVSHLIGEADKKHASFLDYRKKADEFHEKAMEMRGRLNGIRNENRENAMAARKIIGEQNKSAREAIGDKEMLDEKYDEALEKLLKRGKISL